MPSALPRWAASAHHDGSPVYVSAGRLAIGERVGLKVRVALDAPITAAFVRSDDDGEQRMTPLTRAADDARFQWWEGALTLTMPRTNYRFLLLTAEGGWWLSAAGLTRHTPPDATDFKLLAGYHAPAWVRSTVFYQIFPDRFADGDPSNNVQSGEYLVGDKSVIARTWGELPNPKTGYFEFFGGDLQGIIAKLDYLQELGITALYLNPIFTAPSPHKYDVADYEHVDPHFGGDAALEALRRALDERGMRLVLDVVPNHCGATHPWFTAALENPAAPSAEFFTFTRYPDEYAAWLGVRSLPKLNYRSEQLRDMMYAGPNALLRHWMRPPYRIDGWRMDVANMLARQGENQLGHKIGRGIRRAIKDENPEAYLLGEHFYDGTPHLQGNELDASMNYRGFTFPLLQWLDGFDFPSTFGGLWADAQRLPTESVAHQWRAFLALTPWQIALQQFNLLSGHDTPRILTIVRENEALAQVATAILFTFPGVPSVYYGDEIGMIGGKDPDNRRCMVWDRDGWNEAMRELYRRLISLRRTSPALREGGFQLLYAEGDTLAYLRETLGQQIIVVATRGGTPPKTLDLRPSTVADGSVAREVLSGAKGRVSRGRLPLRGLEGPGAQIWVIDR